MPSGHELPYVQTVGDLDQRGDGGVGHVVDWMVSGGSNPTEYRRPSSSPITAIPHWAGTRPETDSGAGANERSNVCSDIETTNYDRQHQQLTCRRHLGAAALYPQLSGVLAHLRT